MRVSLADAMLAVALAGICFGHVSAGMPGWMIVAAVSVGLAWAFVLRLDPDHDQ